MYVYSVLLTAVPSRLQNEKDLRLDVCKISAPLKQKSAIFGKNLSLKAVSFISRRCSFALFEYFLYITCLASPCGAVCAGFAGFAGRSGTGSFSRVERHSL